MTTQVTRLTTLGVPFTIPVAAASTPHVFLGSTGITVFYLGATPVTKIYLGSVEIV